MYIREFDIQNFKMRDILHDNSHSVPLYLFNIPQKEIRNCYHYIIIGILFDIMFYNVKCEYCILGRFVIAYIFIYRYQRKLKAIQNLSAELQKCSWVRNKIDSLRRDS